MQGLRVTRLGLKRLTLKLDAAFAAGNNSNSFLSAYKSYGMNGIDSLVVGHFGEVNKGFKQLIAP